MASPAGSRFWRVGWGHLAACSLAAFLFILPESEALKHLFFGLTAALILLGWSGRPKFDAIDYALVGFAFVPVIAAFTSTLASEVPMSRCTSWLEIATLSILVRRLRPSTRDARWCIRAAVFGTLLSLGLGRFWHGSVEWPHLHSVGFVNQTALYLNVVLAMAIYGVRSDVGAWRWWMWIAAGILGVMIWLSKSATALGAMIAIVLIGFWTMSAFRATRHPVLLRLVVIGLAAVALIASPKVRMHLRGQNISQLVSYRDRALRSALAVFPENPVFGTGARSFQTATSESRVREALQSRGKTFEADQHFLLVLRDGSREPFSHGHGLLPNTLVERGLAGIVCLLVLLVAWSLRFRRRSEDVRFAWLAGLVYVVGGGIGNTTLVVEHGWLLLTFWALLDGTESRQICAKANGQEPISAESVVSSTGSLA
jgi:O-antigen ligase